MSRLKALVAKLNPQSQSALEQAAGLCVKYTHYNVEFSHWLWVLLQREQSVLCLTLREANCDVGQILTDLNRNLTALNKGNQSTPALSPRIVEWLNEAWLMASLENNPKVHSGFLLRSLFKNIMLSQLCQSISPELSKLMDLDLGPYIDLILKRSEEAHELSVQASQSKDSALAQFTINLNEQAHAGKIDPAIGREEEIRLLIDALSRRRQNNAILTGEPGVGKTAIVEGLALKIAQGLVPDQLKPIQIHALDLGLLQAGASIKGEFENRLKSLVQEIKSSATPIILFIDEAHTLVGAGAQAGQSDAANLLKPALARGELRCIAATTWGEYKQYFEKDAALTRRFQIVKVGEPTVAVAIEMLRGIVDRFEAHHQVKVLDSAIIAASALAERYLANRQLPDKSISLLDTACARVASNQSTPPLTLSQAQHDLAQLELKQSRLLAEKAKGIAHHDILTRTSEEIKAKKVCIKTTLERWQQEQILVKSLLNPAIDAKQRKSLESKLKSLQGDNPLVQVFVDEEVVAEVLSDWTGIPIGKILKDEATNMLNLDKVLKARIRGQDQALETIASNIQSARTRLADPNKPLGIFLLVGPSGVGKTETALALAQALYGAENRITTINMSEFKEAHKVSSLAGAPPGYVGYGEGGVLTEAVRRNPYSLVLLDEMEKAHPGIQDVFYQVFDKGILKDGQGRDVTFKNTVIIMTSNACSELITDKGNKFAELNSEAINALLHNELLHYFKPAFLGRVTIIPYLPLSQSILHDIIHLKLARIKTRLKEEHRLTLAIDPAVIETIHESCEASDIGARQLDKVIEQQILPVLSQFILSNIVAKRTVLNASLGYKNQVFSVDAKMQKKKIKRHEFST